MTTTPVYDLLLNAMHDRYEDSVTRLADALGVPVQSASKWLHENERKRTTPKPDSCQKIAEGLSLDPDYVLELAGHRKPSLDAKARVSAWRQSIHAQVDDWMNAVGEENEPVYWDYLKAHGDSGVRLVRRIRTAVSEPEDTAVSDVVSDQPKRGRKPRGTGKGPLRPHQHAASDVLEGRLVTAVRRRALAVRARAA